MCNHFNW